MRSPTLHGHGTVVLRRLLLCHQDTIQEWIGKGVTAELQELEVSGPWYWSACFQLKSGEFTQWPHRGTFPQGKASLWHMWEISQPKITSSACTGPFFTSRKLISRASGNSCIYHVCSALIQYKEILTGEFSRKQEWCKSHIPKRDSKWNSQMTANNRHTKAKALQMEATHCTSSKDIFLVSQQVWQGRPVLQYLCEDTLVIKLVLYQRWPKGPLVICKMKFLCFWCARCAWDSWLCSFAMEQNICSA